MIRKNHTPERTQDFSLIETILWEKGNFFLLGRHMARLEKSAEYFSFPVDFAAVISSLEKTARDFDPQNKYRVRLLADTSGKTSISSSVILPPPVPARIKFSDKKTDKTNIFLSHKTTMRELYDKELKEARKKGYFEVLFTNSAGEVAEGAITNIIIKRGDVYLTPPLSSGVLPGTYREFLFSSRELPLKEQILYPDDVLSADEVFIVNSVIKMIPARF